MLLWHNWNFWVSERLLIIQIIFSKNRRYNYALPRKCFYWSWRSCIQAFNCLFGRAFIHLASALQNNLLQIPNQLLHWMQLHRVLDKQQATKQFEAEILILRVFRRLYFRIAQLKDFNYGPWSNCFARHRHQHVCICRRILKLSIKRTVAFQWRYWTYSPTVSFKLIILKSLNF